MDETTPPPAAVLIGTEEALVILGYGHRSSVSRLVQCGVLDNYAERSDLDRSPILLNKAQVEHVANARNTLAGRKFNR